MTAEFDNLKTQLTALEDQATRGVSLATTAVATLEALVVQLGTAIDPAEIQQLAAEAQAKTTALKAGLDALSAEIVAVTPPA